ncbi:MAG: exosortase H-associated membrane protein [Thermodesulfovibrionales bacterium]
MQQDRRQRLRLIIRTAIIFLISYIAFLVLWIQVKDYYGYAVTYVGSKIVMFIKDVRLEEITEEGKDTLQATFSPLRHKVDILIDIPVKTSSYTFNAPLTLAIMAGLYSYLKKRGRAYLEGLLILLGVHLLYVFSLEAENLTMIFIDRGLEAVNKPKVFFYQFLWQFTDNMIIRFEPFLIGFYMFFRFGKG